MSAQTIEQRRSNIVYPESDGQPMADNTLQFRWIVTIHGGLETLFRHDPHVFVAGDLLWYPVEGNNKLCTAPDVMVAFGRPKGDRRSYRQWEEDGIAPQVVFEILSPKNRPADIVHKFRFYDRYGVVEYYLFDPDTQRLDGWLRQRDELQEIDHIDGWKSPRLGVRFDLSEEELQIIRPDGRPLITFVEMATEAEQAYQRAADMEQRAEQAQRQAERLIAQLRAAGVEPDLS